MPNEDYILPDYNAGGPFQYEVRLRYQSPQEVQELSLDATILAQIANQGGASADMSLALDTDDTIGQGEFQINDQARFSVDAGTAWDTESRFVAIDSPFNNLQDELTASGDFLVVGVGNDDGNWALLNTDGTIDAGRVIYTVVSSAGAIPSSARIYWTGGSTPVANAVTSQTTTVLSSPQDYWCGYINPIESSEAVGTFPIPVTFTATDRLGLLGNQSLIAANVIHDPSLIGYIGRALRQTGLELPLYVDSGIRNANGDALLDVSASAFSFFDEMSNQETLGDRATLKEALEGVLTTFNCKIFQSEGKWWVVNCSTHGNTTDTNVEFAQFVPDTGNTGRDSNNRFPGEQGYIATANIEEYRRATSDDDGGPTVNITNLRYILDDSGTSLTQVYEDPTLTLREPIGSIEARPGDLIQDPLHTNSGFVREADGWNANGSIDSTLQFDTNIFETGGRSIRTSRNRHTINNASEVWFRNTNPFRVDPSSPTNIKFVWRHSEGGRDKRIPFRIRLTLPQAVTYDELGFTNSFSVEQMQRTNDTFYWDFANEQWEDASIGLGYALQQQSGQLFSAEVINRTNGISTDLARGAEVNTWTEVSLDIAPSDRFTNFIDSVDISASTMEIEFFYPQSYRGANGKRQRGDNVGDFTVWIDRVEVTDNFTDDVENPTYEYRQPRHTITEDYEPGFISSGPTTFRQFLLSGGNPVGGNSFWLKDEQASDGRSLEEIGTGLKLADNKDRLRYFEGYIRNRTTTPISQHHKMLINYPNYDGNGIFILNGGSFNVKQNTWDVAAYRPQATELIDGEDVFTPFNVNLVGERFQGGSGKSRYVLEFIVRGINDGTEVEDSIVPIPIIDETFEPGTVINRTLIFTPRAGQVTNLGGTRVTEDSVTTPLPQFVTFGDFQNIQTTRDQGGVTVGGSLQLPISITIPDDHEYEQMFIDIGVMDFVPEVLSDIEEYSVTLMDNITGSSTNGSAITVPVRGSGGNTFLVQHTFTPSNPVTHELLVGNLNTPTESGTTSFVLSSYREAQAGESVTIEIPYEIVAGGEAGATLTFTGSTNTKGTAGNPAYDHSGTISISGLTGVAISPASDSSYSHRGTQGNEFGGSVILEATEGNFLTASGFSVASPPSGVSDIRFDQLSDQAVRMRYTVTFGSATVTGRNIAITGDTTAVRAEPFSVTFVANNLGVDSGSISFSAGSQVSTHRIGYTQANTVSPNNSLDAFPLVISPQQGMMFDGASDVSIDINEASVVNTDTGDRVTLPESQFIVSTDDPVIDDSGRLRFNIDGTFPPTGGNYIIDVSVIGGAILPPATRASVGMRVIERGLGEGSATVNVVTDGTWTVNPPTDQGVVISGTSVTEVVGLNDTSGGFTANWGSTSSDRSLTWNITDGNDNVIGGFTVEQMMLGDITSVALGREYELRASSTQSTTFLIQPTATSGTQPFSLTAGGFGVRESFVMPSIVSGGGNGASVTDLGIADNVAGNAQTASGFTFQSMTSAPPAGTSNATITFVPRN